jgi:heat shock protein HslJ
MTLAASVVLTGHAQQGTASWLDEPTPRSWNTPGASIPAAPKIKASVESRCRQTARVPQLDEDKRVHDQGWDLVGAYQRGRDVLLIIGAASFDGMCRPLQYQDFVFVRSAFAGTLSPQPMDSRTDGALGRVSIESTTRLTAEYARYAPADPLCCPSRTTRVVFLIATDAPVVRPVSASTSRNATPKGNPQSSGSLEGPYWKAIELAGKPTTNKATTSEAHLQFQTGGHVSGSDGCNRISGTYQLNGDRITFGTMAATQMACLDPSGNEQAFREALKNAVRLTVTRNRLELFDAAGARLAAFVAANPPSTSTSTQSPGLGATSWQLVKIHGNDVTTLTSDDREKYTIEFGADGSLSARVDCNRGRGTWKTTGPGQIEFGPLALTRAQCPPGSLHDQIVKQWTHVRSYVVLDGRLTLMVMPDGGSFEFERRAPQH